MKKYELLDMNHFVLDVDKKKHAIKKIRYLVDIPEHQVTSGSLGGWLESEDNLSHEGTCVVLEDAKVFGNARITEHAKVRSSARVQGEAQISGSVCVRGFSNVFGQAVVTGNATIKDFAQVKGNSRISGYVQIEEESVVDVNESGKSQEREFDIMGYVIIKGNSRIENDAYLYNELSEEKALIIDGKSIIKDSVVVKAIGLVNNSIIEGSVFIQSDEISPIIIEEETHIFNANFLKNVKLYGCTIHHNVDIVKSNLFNCKIQHAVQIVNSYLKNCDMMGAAYIKDSSLVEVSGSDEVIVCNSQLTGFEESPIKLYGKSEIHSSTIEFVLSCSIEGQAHLNQVRIKDVKYLSIGGNVKFLVEKNKDIQFRITNGERIVLRDSARLECRNGELIVMDKLNLQMSDYTVVYGNNSLTGDISLSECSIIQNTGNIRTNSNLTLFGDMVH